MSDRPYEIVIGIETHVELATRSKMFCGCSARTFGAPPNTLVCPVCLGLPGALPVPNRRAIELAITAGLALHCETPEHTKFDRKNYMYPDLPKGYQISQYDLPLNVNGWLEIPADGGGTKRVGIIRAHLEEDTGKLLHGAGYSLVDFNRSGVPLLEIVSAPDMRSVAEALAYTEALREILIYSGVSEFRLEEGAARFDTNVSIRFQQDGATVWPPQSEIKNLNSYRALEQSVTYEAERLWEDWRAGGEIRSRKGKITVGWSPDTGRTFLQRRKEESEDYRYFPEPDLVTYAPSRDTVEALRAALPEMPRERRARFVAQYGISEHDATVLVSDPALAAFYEQAAGAAAGQAKAVANWVTGELLRHLREKAARPSDIPIRPEHVAALVRLVASGTISGTTAKDVFAEMWATGQQPDRIVAEKGLEQVSDESAIGGAVDEVIAADPKAVADYKAGKTRALEALFGKVMGGMKGKGNPQTVRRLLTDRLSEFKRIHHYDLAPDTWFRRKDESSVWIAAYRVFRVANWDELARHPLLVDFVQVQVRAHLYAGDLDYQRVVAELVSQGPDFRIDVSGPLQAKSPSGAYWVLLTPMKVDSRPGDEAAARARIASVVGLLIAFEGRNAGFDLVFENEYDYGRDVTSIASHSLAVPSGYPAPNLSDERVRYIAAAETAIEKLRPTERQRIRLALRWLQLASYDSGVDAFLKHWIALETLAMPDTTDIGPLADAVGAAHGVDGRTAKDALLIGRIYGVRGRIVHGGEELSIHTELTDHLANLFFDALTNVLRLTPERRAAKTVDAARVVLPPG